MKENQPENNRSNQSLDSALSKSSSQQPLLAPSDNSLTGVQHHHHQSLQKHQEADEGEVKEEEELGQQPTTCNDSAINRECIHYK